MPPPPAPPVRVLLVDDNPANLLALEAILADPGLELVRAATGEEAVERLTGGEEVAAVVMDLRLPGITGFEAARQIRSHPCCREMPVIFVTAEGDSFPVIEAYKLGAVDYLVKPLVTEVLRAKVAVFVDLFRQKAQARREADQFRQLVQQTTDYAIFMLDPAGHVATWNAGAARIKGYGADEIVGRHFSTFYPAEAVARDWPGEELRRAVADGRFEDEGWRVRKDGTTFWANVVITALRDEAGTLRGFSKVTRDLTERKQREEDLKALHQDLERRVEERTAALAASNRALQQANRHKDEFLALLAHELRNPLAPVRNALSIQALKGDDPAVVEMTRGLMERQVRHLTRMVDDLLDAARFTQGKVRVQRERVDLAALVRTAVADRRPEFAEAGVTLRLTPAAGPAWVSGDPTRLTQVLDNLLTNARKFTPRGGTVEVSLAADPGRRQAAVRVRDTGVGIDPAVLPTLFEPFTQADRSLDRMMGGLGLGLSLVRGIAELHGGTAEAHSDGDGTGAEFVVRLPLAGEPAALAGSAGPLPGAGAARRVLVIEDHPDAAASLRHLLTLLGHEVRVSMTGPDGVRVADEWRPDVVLCDIGLPGLDGYGVAGELRRLSVASTARLIAVTGYGSDEDRRRALDAGFHHHVTKPADPAVLLRLLNTVVA